MGWSWTDTFIPEGIMKFILEIELGNDAMRNRADVARKLKEVAADLVKVYSDRESARIRDLNGNTVGKWEFLNE